MELTNNGQFDGFHANPFAVLPKTCVHATVLQFNAAQLQDECGSGAYNFQVLPCSVRRQQCSVVLFPRQCRLRKRTYHACEGSRHTDFEKYFGAFVDLDNGFR